MRVHATPVSHTYRLSVLHVNAYITQIIQTIWDKCDMGVPHDGTPYRGGTTTCVMDAPPLELFTTDTTDTWHLSLLLLDVFATHIVSVLVDDTHLRTVCSKQS